MATWQLNPLTTKSNAGSLAAYVFNSQGTQHVIYIDNNDLHVHELWSYGDGTWHPNDLTKATGALDSSKAYPLAAYVWDLGEIRSLGGGLPPVLIPSLKSTQHVDYIDANNDVHELWWHHNGWFENDLSKRANVSLPGAVLASGYVFHSQGTQHVIYNGGDGRVHELWWDSNGWHPNDLTLPAAQLLSPPPAQLVGCAFDSQGSQHIFYPTYDGNVHELLWDTSGWHHNYLTGSGLLPGPAQTTLAAYVSNAQGTLQVVYIDRTDSHVYLLWSSGNGIWNPVDLTKESQASVVSLGIGGLTGYVTAGGTQYIAYTGDDSHVHELSWDGNSQPVDDDLTSHVALKWREPISGDGSMVGYAVGAQGTRHVIYIGDDGNIYELRLS